MSSHGPSMVVQNGAGENGVNGKKRLFIHTWTIAQFRVAARNVGNDVRMHQGYSPRCKFPECKTRMLDPDRSFTENEKIGLWRVSRRGEDQRILPCCAEHNWSDIRTNDDASDVSIERIAGPEHQMIEIFARALGFYLVKIPNPTSVIVSSESHLAAT